MVMRFVVTAGVVLLGACSVEKGGAGPLQFATYCEDPRPQICTRDYRPVCATRDNGIRCVTTPCPSTETATYGNACDACADPAVYYHQPGECKD